MTALAVALGCSLVAGCDGSSPATTPSTAAPTVPATSRPAPATEGARARLGRVLRRLQNEPYRVRSALHQTFDAAGAPPELSRALAGLPSTTVTTAAVESPRRATAVATLPIGPAIRPLRIVMYDGAVFISGDGRDWRRATGDLAGVFAQAITIATADPLERLTGVRDAGPAAFVGAAARRYTGALDPAAVRDAVGAIFVRLGVDPGLLRIVDGRADFFVRRADGQLVGQRTTQRMELDLSRLPGGLEGTLTIAGILTIRYRDHGHPVRIRRPTASGTVATPAELVAFLH
jgi:hypothetical protein